MSIKRELTVIKCMIFHVQQRCSISTHSKVKFLTTDLPGNQGAKKIIFTACHSGKLKLAFTSPDVISTSSKSFSSSRIDFTFLLLFKFLKEHHLPVGQVKTDFTSPIAKFTSPGLSDTTFFARCW